MFLISQTSKDKGEKKFSPPELDHEGSKGRTCVGLVIILRAYYTIAHIFPVLLLHVGCWFGVKGNEKLGVFMPGINQCDLAAVDVCSTAESLSQELLELLFTKDEMARGCATKPRKEGIQKLDNRRLHAIRS